MENKPKEYKCVTLIGELSDWGKHVLLPFGCTLCGMPTVDCNKEEMPQLKNPLMADMINKYTEHKEWNITCEKCLEVMSIVAQANEIKKQKYN